MTEPPAPLNPLHALFLRQADPAARPLPPDLDMAELRRLRHDCRVENGGGGCCHIVTEVLEERHGWTKLSVAYLAPSMEVALAPHLISLLPDGSLLDATVDQFADGDDIRLIRPDDSLYRRYRPEIDDVAAALEDPMMTAALAWTGEAMPTATDECVCSMLAAERGTGWWGADFDRYRRYHQEQARLAAASGNFPYKQWSLMQIDLFHDGIDPHAVPAPPLF